MTLHCGADETEDAETGYTVLPDINSILFGNEWYNPESALADTSIQFSETQDSVIYYEIKLDTNVLGDIKIRKIWDRRMYGGDSLNLFSSVVLVTEGSRRICGEFRRPDYGTITEGTYYLTIKYYNSKDSEYENANYNQGVNRVFTVDYP